MKKVLGLDLGTTTLGIALSRTGIIASGYENFRFPEGQYDSAIKRVQEIVKLEAIEHICIGYPLHMSGDESDMSKQVLIFKEKLEELFPNIKVKLIDERWSTKQATRTLLEADTSRAKRKKVIDKMAAQVILETYISQGE